MRASANGRPRELLVERDETVIAEPVTVDGREMVRYSVIAPEEVLPSGVVRGSVEDVLSLAGAWSDLDWDEMVDALDRIRHESVPTPPIEFDDE